MQVLYFSWIRETIGSDEEIVALAPTVHTVGDLLAKLCRRGANYQRAFSDPGRVRAAVNQTHVTLDHPVSAGDEVAFFPPVTGG
ncbi:MAG: molybdopterin converting factor subunit 1 [Alphaproteobacteria bacterium]|nr:MAG: molybdopterin converting factor subunit 1 [Alphaproteobacteria bacterium]